MEENQYVIISKTAIQQRIEELEKEEEDEFFDEQKVNNLLGQIHALKQILSLSTPLIPEIEKAYEAGKLDEELSKTFDNPKGRYFNNLKLDT